MWMASLLSPSSQTPRVQQCVRSSTRGPNLKEDRREPSSCAAGTIKTCQLEIQHWTKGRSLVYDFLSSRVFVQSAALQTVRRTSWKRSTPSSGRSSAASFWRRSPCHLTSSTFHLGANVFVLSKGHGPSWTEQVTGASSSQKPQYAVSAKEPKCCGACDPRWVLLFFFYFFFLFFLSLFLFFIFFVVFFI